MKQYELGKGERLAALATLARTMLSVEQHGWLGRTHLQKAVFFAQELMEVDLGYEFTIYQYGPYSSLLDAEIHELQTMGALQMVMIGGYPDYRLGENILPLLDYFRKGPLASEEQDLERLAKLVAPRKARELELFTTIAFLRKQGIDDESLLDATRRLKPHFSESQIRQGLIELDQISELLRGTT